MKVCCRIDFTAPNRLIDERLSKKGIKLYLFYDSAIECE